MKKVTEFKKGDLVAFFEGGFNHVVGVLMDQPDAEGASLAATSLTFGASDVDFIYIQPNQKMSKFISKAPAVLEQYIAKYSK